MTRTPAALALLIAALAGPAAAGPDIPPAEARLVVGGPAAAGYDAGVAIDLPEGWHTYWRSPGDSGVPPTFDTTGSDNLARIEVAYPAPRRYFDGFGTSIVYEQDVLLPLRIVPKQADSPVRLAIRFDYGYCREICVPASATFEADLAPGDAADTAGVAAIAAARAAVPVPAAAAGPADPRILAVAREGADAKGHVDVTVAAAGAADAVDLFVEGPDGWYLSPPEAVARKGGQAVFRLSLDGMPKGANPEGTALRFTLVDGAHAVEDVRPLP